MVWCEARLGRVGSEGRGFKKVGKSRGQEVWSARVTLNYRTMALRGADGFLWFGIGDHKSYEGFI